MVRREKECRRAQRIGLSKLSHSLAILRSPQKGGNYVGTCTNFGVFKNFRLPTFVRTYLWLSLALISAPPPTVSNFHHLFSFSSDIPALIRRFSSLCLFSSQDKSDKTTDQVLDLEARRWRPPASACWVLQVVTRRCQS